MDKPEAQYREMLMALKYCGLDYKEILEDYREHLKEIRHRFATLYESETIKKPTRARLKN